MSKLDQIRALREGQFSGAPQPALFGLYRCYDAAGSLLYVGQSISPLQRLDEEHRLRYAGLLARVEISWHTSKAEVLAAETAAIQNETPADNKSPGNTLPRLRQFKTESGTFDRKAYQREYMRKRRAAQKA